MFIVSNMNSLLLITVIVMKIVICENIIDNGTNVDNKKIYTNDKSI